MPPRANAEYVRLRERMIPIAEAHADKRQGKSSSDCSEKGREQWAAAWSYDFHTKMNELVEGAMKKNG